MLKKVLIFFALLGLGIGGQYLYIHKKDKAKQKKEINHKTYLKDVSKAFRER